MVDSQASMHMISRKVLKSAELETVRISRCPTSVTTANGEVQTHEEATVYVRDLDIFLTVKNRRRYANLCSRSESFARITDIPKSGPMVRSNIP